MVEENNGFVGNHSECLAVQAFGEPEEQAPVNVESLEGELESDDSFAQLEKLKRKRLTKKETDDLYRNFIALCKYGCSIDAVESILEQDKRMVEKFALRAVRQREPTEGLENRVVVHRLELPADLSERVEAEGKDFFVFTFDSDDPSGYLELMTREKILEESCKAISPK